MGRHLEIAGRKIGAGEPVYVIAEMSANHHQDYEQAVRILHAAKEAGADAVKLQTYTPETMTMDSRKEPFRIGKGTLWEGRNLYELYQEAYTPWEWHPRLAEVAADLGLTLFSTPFDATAVDFLEEMHVPAHKIASFEIVDLPLIKRVAQTGKPIIMSTGMATLAEIEEAVTTIRGEGNDQIALLKCTSAYPAKPEEMNLRTIPHLAEAFDVPVGLSDHTLGVAVPVSAVALGASLLEKHLTLSRSDPGPDSAFSLEPAELQQLVREVRTAELSLGAVQYRPTAGEVASRVFRRSLFVVRDLAEGAPITQADVRAIRPGDGLHTRYLEQVLGRRAARRIEAGTPLDWSLIK